MPETGEATLRARIAYGIGALLDNLRRFDRVNHELDFEEFA
jgi:hypothetical protein